MSENDWVLPEPDLLVSGLHASVHFQDGVYYLEDMSATCLYINGL